MLIGLAIPVAKIKDIGVCWNDCFRKLFGYKRFESVKEVQYFCGELSFDLIYELQQWISECCSIISSVIDFPVPITCRAIL